MAIYKCDPIYDQTIWADNRLSKIRNVEGEGWGTSWEISFHPYGSNKVNSTNKTLLELLNEDKEALIGDLNPERVLRYAYLDAKSDLSIQLHPTNEYARDHGVDYGKYEAWYVIAAEPKATLVAGSKTTDPELFKKAIEDGSLEEHLIYHEVKPGDFIYVPAGCVHALGGGILAIEIGTNSNTTYRVYDYGRTDKEGNTRELHLDKVFDNLDLTMKPGVGHLPPNESNENRIDTFMKTDYFSWTCIDLVDEVEIDTLGEALYLTVLTDDLSISSNEETVSVNNLDHVVISAECGLVRLKGAGRVLVGRAES